MKNHFPLLFLCLLLLSGCVASSVSSRPNSVAATGVKTLNFKTYAWFQDQPAAPIAYGERYTGSLNKHIRQAVEEELQKKGFTKATGANPDILVAYDVSVSVPVEKDIDTNYIKGFGYSYAYMSGYRYNYGNEELPGYRAVDLYKSGTLIIDLVNPKTNELMWRGWKEGAISNFKAGYSSVRSEVEKVLEPLQKR
ncbi:DUF4136 domain-containing protein [Pontibacter sp. BT310]|uniref:DUF4136 domain-containing protein n=1 Tax=Pontibacter populi TaxID=890055 RepID=A0ABS6XF63_9BACT|nr:MULTISPECIES: DUF4136 domain-containing protein [Pontibacter]MBJ6119775.1 DUF4136 domain-containing protein [Pontibacter sp. BT310]MBR0572204.1 DUF4136 domain-containing protein [Microvirga sp. STS03]MBW3366628.1 DUF4136 domain-containing protein [Pontibacter populi]